jgi:hypothetical protein
MLLGRPPEPVCLIYYSSAAIPLRLKSTPTMIDDMLNDLPTPPAARLDVDVPSADVLVEEHTDADGVVDVEEITAAKLLSQRLFHGERFNEVLSFLEQGPVPHMQYKLPFR